MNSNVIFPEKNKKLFHLFNVEWIRKLKKKILNKVENYWKYLEETRKLPRLAFFVFSTRQRLFKKFYVFFHSSNWVVLRLLEKKFLFYRIFCAKLPKRRRRILIFTKIQYGVRFSNTIQIQISLLFSHSRLLIPSHDEEEKEGFKPNNLCIENKISSRFNACLMEDSLKSLSYLILLRCQETCKM